MLHHPSKREGVGETEATLEHTHPWPWMLVTGGAKHVASGVKEAKVVLGRAAIVFA